MWGRGGATLDLQVLAVVPPLHQLPAVVSSPPASSCHPLLTGARWSQAPASPHLEELASPLYDSSQSLSGISNKEDQFSRFSSLQSADRA